MDQGSAKTRRHSQKKHWRGCNIFCGKTREESTACKAHIADEQFVMVHTLARIESTHLQNIMKH